MTESPAQRTVLYIEDDPASRSLVERTLRFAGFRVVTAERGLQGIDLARQSPPDLVLVDINLPDLSGREVATMLRTDARFERIPIVALTAQAMTEQRQMSIAAGIDGYLTKPLDVEHLPRQLEFYLGGGHDLLESAKMGNAQASYAREVVMRLERRVRELEKFSQDLTRLDQVKDAFINISAHELRTPLTLLVGYNRLLLENAGIREVLAADEGARLLVEGMSQSITRMQGIINEILTISRIITNRLEIAATPVSLIEIIQRAIDYYATILRERRLELSADLAGAPSRMMADLELLELTMRNVIGNAIKYTPDKGRISITVTAKPGRGPDDTTVLITVQDTGIGIPRDSLDRIFERFNTTSDPMLHSTSKTAFRGGGIGLGLAVARGVVEAHGGRIWAESPGYDPQRNPGSTFNIILPLVVNPKKGTKGGFTSISSKG